MADIPKLETGQEYRYVTIHSRINSAMIRREQRNGKDVIIAPAKTMRDNEVLNRVMYPAEELRDSYRSLNRTFVPLEHPVDDQGRFMSANSPEGMEGHYIGAHSENVRRVPDGDGSGLNRIHADVVIYVDRAKKSPGGQRVLNALEKGEPISTSTGLYGIFETVAGNEDFDYVARFINFDHNAILLDTEPAASTDQGTGIFVNSNQDQLDVKRMVVNMDLETPAVEMNDGDTQPKEVTVNLEDKDAVTGLLNRLLAIFGKQTGAKNANNKTELVMDEETKKAFSATNERIEEVAKTVVNKDDLKEVVTEVVNEIVKPLAEEISAQAETRKNQHEVEKAKLVKRVVAANKLSEEAANATPIEVLRELAGNEEDGKADAVTGNGDQTKANDAKDDAEDFASALNKVGQTDGKE